MRLTLKIHNVGWVPTEAWYKFNGPYDAEKFVQICTVTERKTLNRWHTKTQAQGISKNYSSIFCSCWTTPLVGGS